MDPREDLQAKNEQGCRGNASDIETQLVALDVDHYSPPPFRAVLRKMRPVAAGISAGFRPRSTMPA